MTPTPTDSPAPLTCSQPGCQVAKDGKCVENLDTTKCPFYGKASTTAEHPNPAQSASLSGTGAGLTTAEAGEVLASYGGTIVVLAGESNSGKTTLLTTIYESFLERPFADQTFAGSNTLLGFEQRTYLNRTAYAVERADTLHTPQSSPEPFLHLRLRAAPFHKPATNLFLADVSGEGFKRATDMSDALNEIPGLHRADNIGFLMDGDLLRGPATRQGVVTSTRQILDACFEKGAIGSGSRVQLIVTKHDLWHDDPVTVAFVGSKTAELVARIGTRAREARVFFIAARPTRDNFGFAHGVDDLFRYWMETQPGPSPAPSLPDPRTLLRSLIYGDSDHG